MERPHSPTFYEISKQLEETTDKETFIRLMKEMAELLAREQQEQEAADTKAMSASA